MRTTENLADVCPENYDIAEVIRGLERFCKGGSHLNWPRSRRGQSDLLNQFLEEQASDRDRILAGRISGQSYTVGGDEHHLLVLPDEPARIFKITHSDSFGCRIRFFRADPDLTEKHLIPEVNEDPFIYLRRWMILNSLTGYRTKFEGMLPPQGNLLLPRICVSQPILPRECANPPSTLIKSALQEYGFSRVALDGYANHGGILLADAAPRNLWVVDGVPVPFDALAEYATPEIQEWLAERESFTHV